jgi:ABC-type uncharacterized transport system substrate-binding protein
MPILLSRSARSRFRQALCGLLWLLLPLHCVAQDLNVLLILSGSAPPYQKFATAFRQNLPPDVHVNQLEHANAFPGVERQTDLIVTVGLKAGSWAAAHTAKPLLAAMLPSQRYADLLAERRSTDNLSAIFVDQPWSRQVHLLRAALPDSKHIGLLHSPGDGLDTAQLRKLLAEHGAILVEQTTNPSATLFDSLSNVLSRSDVLLAVPDGEIYNGNNIRNILLSSYRQRVPLVGLSQAYVNAGALCAVFSTPENLAVQASAETVSFARTRLLPKAQFPQYYSVAVNREVAVMLGIRLESAEHIKSQIEQAEK